MSHTVSIRNIGGKVLFKEISYMLDTKSSKEKYITRVFLIRQNRIKSLFGSDFSGMLEFQVCSTLVENC